MSPVLMVTAPEAFNWTVMSWHAAVGSTLSSTSTEAVQVAAQGTPGIVGFARCCSLLVADLLGDVFQVDQLDLLCQSRDLLLQLGLFDKTA